MIIGPKDGIRLDGGLWGPSCVISNLIMFDTDFLIHMVAISLAWK